MKYQKETLTLEDQVQKLQKRGLEITDPHKATQYLSNISFYRLRAYTYPFQDNTNPEHPFIVKVSFEDIISLYTFDRKLRLLVLDAIEKIEIAIRTQIIYQWALSHGSHWQLNPLLFRNSVKFAKQISSLQKEINRSNETFIKHYKKTYSQPTEPPSWMSLEVSSFGLLSLMYSNLKRGKEKKAVAKHFGLYDVELMENWMRSFCDIRNICAHHSRLWNRRLSTHIDFPNKPIYPFLDNTSVYPYKIYSAISAMVYIINTINPTSTFKEKIKELMNHCPMQQEKEMGFPIGWREDSFWKKQQIT